MLSTGPLLHFLSIIVTIESLKGRPLTELLIMKMIIISMKNIPLPVATTEVEISPLQRLTSMNELNF
jgi:hypothetical protein